MKKDLLILLTLLIIAFALRLYKVQTPLADLHSWRQVDTASVARNFVKTGFNLMKPRYDDLSSIESGKENPKGYRFVEFPIYNAIFAFIYKIFPSLPIEVYGRLTSSFFSLIIIALIYFFSLKESGRITAVIASFVYAVFPFFVYFSRMVLPETTALSLVLLSIFFLYLWSQEKIKFKEIVYYSLSLLLFGLSILVKPTVGFYGISLIYLFIKKQKQSFLIKPWIYIFFIFSLTPFILWRYYISFFPEGIPSSSWLINQVNTFEGVKDIFFRPAFFRWIFFERIGNMIFGGYLAFFFILGVITKTKKYFLFSLLVSSFVYLFTFQGGNVQHEYYQILLLPPIAIFIGLGVNYVLRFTKTLFNPFLSYIMIISVFILSFYFSFYKIKDFYNYPTDLVKIAKVISSLTKEDDKIITDRLGDTTLLYLANRKGSPANYKDLSEFKRDDYKYFVTANIKTIEDIKQKKEYQVIFDNSEFAIIKL